MSSSSLLALAREGRNDFTCDRAEGGNKKEGNKKKDSEEMERGGVVHIKLYIYENKLTCATSNFECL